MAGATVKRDEPPVSYPPVGGLVPEPRFTVAKTVLTGLRSLQSRISFTHAARGGFVRTRFMLVLGAVCAACHSLPGPAFSGESHLALPPEAEAAHDELLNADITRGDAVRR